MGDNIIELDDMPVMPKATGKGNQVNSYALAAILRDSGVKMAYVETVHAMPGQGVTSMFSFGKAAGTIEGVLAGLEIPVTFVTPQAWKKPLGLLKKDKDVSRTLAIQLFPALSEQLKRKKDGGRADALLIARHGMSTPLQL